VSISVFAASRRAISRAATTDVCNSAAERQRRFRASKDVQHASITAALEEAQQQLRAVELARRDLDKQLDRCRRDFDVQQTTLVEVITQKEQWREMAARWADGESATAQLRAARRAALEAHESALVNAVRLERERQRADDEAEDAEFHRGLVAELSRRESELVEQLGLAVHDADKVCVRACSCARSPVWRPGDQKPGRVQWRVLRV
jgi:hypothetical protein